MVFLHSLLLALITGVLYIGAKNTIKEGLPKIRTNLFALLLVLLFWLWILKEYIEHYWYLF